VAVHAAGVNPVDAGSRADGSWAGLRVPCILGYDIAGVVDAAGPGVTGWAPGDRVMAMTHFRDGAGGYAELAVVPADLLARIDDGTSFTDAAATPVAGGTAAQVLARLALPPGARLLVLGASGGVGLFLLQLAAAGKLEVVAVGRRVMHDQMRALGAASCVDYTRENVDQRAVELAGGPVDAIADLVGGHQVASAMAALRPGGHLAAIATPELDIDQLVDENITFHGVLIGDDGERTRRLAALLAEGAVRPVVSHVLPLADAPRAHEIVEDGHPGGKVVLTVAG
jgi:NADPH:quinone reductase